MPVRSIRDVALKARGRRLDLGLSQAELAQKAHVSRKWIYQFEQGKQTAELGLVLRVLDALGLTLELLEAGVPTDPAEQNLDDILAQFDRAERRPLA